MFGLSVSEWFFYGGLAIMGASVAAAIVSTIVLVHSGRRLKTKLEQEYGKPQQ